MTLGRTIGMVALSVGISFLSLGLVPDRVCATEISESNLSKLELKFFEHDYAKDSNEARIERLEKLVFGEARTGSLEERLSSLLATVPNLNSPQASQQPVISGEGPAGESQTTPQPAAEQPGGSQPLGAAANPEPAATPAAEPEVSSADSSKYPAITAIENKLFGKDYSSEPVNKRLDRLELKVFGRTSATDDLSDRMDRVKQKTGIDIAKQAPPGSDWADDDDSDYMPPTQVQPPVASGADALRNYSGRNSRLPSSGMGNQNFSGTYGMNPPASSSGSFGSAPPATSSDYDGAGGPPNVVSQAPAMGLNQQVTALESEIYGRNYPKDTLPVRLNRLESTVFPNEKAAVDKALPQRVSRLLAVIPLSASSRIAQNSRRGRQSADPDDLDFSQPMPGQPRGTSGISKIISSMSNLLTGGFAGGYPVPATGSVVTDPQTGLLWDRLSGNLIDPTTGVVVGQRVVPGMGTNTGGFGSFNNGFAPFGSSPYGMGSGSGIRFGFGNIGRFGGGLWP